MCKALHLTKKKLHSSEFPENLPHLNLVNGLQGQGLIIGLQPPVKEDTCEVSVTAHLKGGCGQFWAVKGSCGKLRMVVGSCEL